MSVGWWRVVPSPSPVMQNKITRAPLFTATASSRSLQFIDRHQLDIQIAPPGICRPHNRKG
jgi:hypothetical protein